MDWNEAVLQQTNLCKEGKTFLMSKYGILGGIFIVVYYFRTCVIDPHNRRCKEWPRMRMCFVHCICGAYFYFVAHGDPWHYMGYYSSVLS